MERKSIQGGIKMTIQLIIAGFIGWLMLILCYFSVLFANAYDDYKKRLSCALHYLYYIFQEEPVTYSNGQFTWTDNFRRIHKIAQDNNINTKTLIKKYERILKRKGIKVKI